MFAGQVKIVVMMRIGSNAINIIFLELMQIWIPDLERDRKEMLYL